MLQSRTTDGPEGVTLEGDDAGFLALHALVMAGGGTIELTAEGDPSPYPRFLRRLVVEETTTSSARFMHEPGSDELIVRCPKDLRDVVASNLAPVGVEPGYHTHYEWHPDHDHLTADSVPVVVEHV